MPAGRSASETTPLLKRNWSDSFRRFGRRKSDSGDHEEAIEDLDEAVDIDDHIVRVRSYTSSSGLEPHNSDYRHHRPTEDDSDDQHSDTVNEEPQEIGDPRFNNISTKRFWATFPTLLLVYFIVCFDSTLMSSSHPVITSYFNASEAAPWLSTVFLITSTAFQPLYGRLSDLVGRKVVFILTTTMFILTTVWCALATTIESFVAARAVAGLAGGGAIALASIVTSDLVKSEYRGIFQSHINIAWSVGAGCGTAFGGYLCDRFGWRWAFGFQVPIITVSLISTILFMPSSLGPMLIKKEGGNAWATLKNFDGRGSVLLVTAVTTLVLVLNLGGSIFPWLSPVVITCAVVCAITTVLFIWRETKAKQPLMPMRLLTKHPVANLIFSNFFGAITNITVVFNVPLFFQAVLLTSASESGLRMALPVIGASLPAISTGYIITYTRKMKPVMVVGALFYVIGSVMVTFLNKNMSKALISFLIMGVSCGQGFTFPSTMVSALAISKQADLAVVTTTLGLWRNLGTVMGVAISSFIMQNSLNINLHKKVTGPDRQEIIKQVRSSVKSIKLLDPYHQLQVINAYEASLRATFASCLITAIVVALLILPMKLPQLKPRVAKSANRD